MFGSLFGRRSLLQLPFSFLALGAGKREFHYDGVLGTSLDLAVSRVSWSDAGRVESVVLEEVERLRRILSTYDSSSEISRVNASLVGGLRAVCSGELFSLLRAYDRWQVATGGVVSPTLRRERVTLRGSDRSVSSSSRLSLNVDALGKSFIIESAVNAARAVAPSAGIMLNIGGDIVVKGAHELGIMNPSAHADNAAPLGRLNLRNGAVVTSGFQARGRHIVDARTGVASAREQTATVVASDAVTANALSTALCILDPAEGISLVDRTAGAEALIVESNGAQHRSAGFSRLMLPGQPRIVLAQGAAKWPTGFQVEVIFTLKPHQEAFNLRPYVAIWAEDAKENHVKTLAAWVGNKRWMRELYYWTRSYGEVADPNAITRPTRTPGRYTFTWDGLDYKGAPVPAGNYTMHVETSREHGPYCKQSVVLACGGDKTVSAVTKDMEDFLPVQISYGVKGQGA
jgi:thiamine biosynthesis lipoprotein